MNWVRELLIEIFYREHRGLEVCKLLLLLLLGGHFANLSNRYASSPRKGLPTLIHVITVTSSDSTNTCASGTECFSILLMLVPFSEFSVGKSCRLQFILYAIHFVRIPVPV
jgi:hypothetical protein